MTRRCVTDEQYGNLWRRVTELIRRVDEGTILYKYVMDGLQDLIEKKDLIEKTAKFVYDIMVDYKRSLADMIKAGKYDCVNSDINAKHFPLKGKGKHKLTATLFHFDRDIESDDAIAEMDKQGYRLGTIEELLTLGERYPDLQKEFPIVALAYVWRDPHGTRWVPYLHRSVSNRFLHLYWFDYRWTAHFRFLAFRK